MVFHTPEKAGASHLTANLRVKTRKAIGGTRQMVRERKGVWMKRCPPDLPIAG